MSRTKKTSFLRMLGIELNRGLHERRFWVMAAVLVLFCLLSIVLRSVWPVSQYYYGGEEGIKIWASWGFLAEWACGAALNNTVWKVYFPFLAAAAYAHVLPDDRKNGYAVQLIAKEGFGHYIAVKLCAGSILGGIMGAIPVLSTLLSVLLGIQKNPLLSDILQYYNETMSENPIRLYWKGTAVGGELSWVEWMLLGAISWFILGMIFGLVAGMIGMWTQNKLLIYVMPVVGLQLWDVCVSVLPLSGALQEKIYLKNYMGTDGFIQLSGYPVWAVILIILICVSVLIYPKVKDAYSEGGR